MSDNVQRKDVQLLRKDLQSLSRAISKLTGAIGEAASLPRMELLGGMELTAEQDQVLEISMTVQAAVATLKEICKDATDCGEDCPIFDWCQHALPDDRAAMPPKYWQLPE